MSSATVTLFRPTGPSELALIEASGFRSFPPRLPNQPISYPALNLEYATQIARDWNVKSSGAGFVLQFEVEKQFLDSFEVHQVGGRIHVEYWIPAERLEEFKPTPRWTDHARRGVPGTDVKPVCAALDDFVAYSRDRYQSGRFMKTHV